MIGKLKTKGVRAQFECLASRAQQYEQGVDWYELSYLNKKHATPVTKFDQNSLISERIDVVRLEKS